MDNELKPVDVKCDYHNMPTRFRKIVLPAYIMRVVRYRDLHVQSPKIENLEAIVAYFLTSDPRYCQYFEVLEVQEDKEDDPVSQAEDPKKEAEKEAELQEVEVAPVIEIQEAVEPHPIIEAVELPEPAPKEPKEDEQKEPAKKQTAKKKAAKRRARKPKAKKEVSNNG